MKKKSIALLVVICVLPFLAASAQAQTGIVFAGRAANTAADKAHVTFIGDVTDSGIASGRIVIGGYFVSADATGSFSSSIDPKTGATRTSLVVSAYDADLDGIWQLTADDDGLGGEFFHIGFVGSVGSGFTGSGDRFVLNTH